MKRNSTEQKIIKIIAEHYLNACEGRLTINTVCGRAGISRQAFNSYYKHLKSYLTGNKPVSELMSAEDDGYNNLLATAQKKLSELQSQLKQIEGKHKKELESVESRYITSLMNNDISLKETDEVRLTLERQALHNEQLLKQKQSLDQELTLLKARNYDLQNSSERILSDMGEVIVADPDMRAAFSNYKKNKDINALEDEKDTALDQILRRINKSCQVADAEVIIYIDLYISDFTKFVKSYKSTGSGTHILVRLPVFTRTELKIFISKIKPVRPVTVYVPYCNSETVIKAQHTFIHRDVPDYELQAAGQFVVPSIKDGFETLVIFRVKQGD